MFICLLAVCCAWWLFVISFNEYWNVYIFISCKLDLSDLPLFIGIKKRLAVGKCQLIDNYIKKSWQGEAAQWSFARCHKIHEMQPIKLSCVRVCVCLRTQFYFISFYFSYINKIYVLFQANRLVCAREYTYIIYKCMYSNKCVFALESSKTKGVRQQVHYLHAHTLTPFQAP